MRLLRCARGICFLAVLLFIGAILLDSPAALLAGTALLTGLLGQYILFCRRFWRTTASVEVKRSLSRTLMRRGTTVRVTSSIAVTVPAPLRVELREKIPSILSVQDGDTVVTAPSGPGRQEFRLSYRIMPVMYGTTQLPGLVLIARDRFFEAEADLTARAYAGPSLVVQPTGLFERGGKRTTTETREIEKMSLLSGLGIRALREYYAGDDLRHIDWKASAKHDKLFVREYAGVTSLAPVIIADLPWRGSSFSPAEFDRMAAKVTGMAEFSIRTYQYASVLIISGPNILHFIENEKDIQTCISALREWMHPAERAVHLYHAADRADLRSHIRAIEDANEHSADPADRQFLSSLRAYYRATLGNQKMYTFSAQIARTLASVTTEEAYIFSLFCGDSSHLRLLARQAKTEKLVVHVRVPESRDAMTRSSYQAQVCADTLEAFT